MDEDARVAALMQKMLRKKLYVLISTPRVAPEKLKPLLATHLDYMVDLERRGLLFASGPLTDTGGAPSGHGLTILRTKDAAEARAIAEAEPFVAQGLRSFELKEWTVMEGTLGLRVNLSDQSIEVA
jgi:uncharacterized protein YciI